MTDVNVGAGIGTPAGSAACAITSAVTSMPPLKFFHSAWIV